MSGTTTLVDETPGFLHYQCRQLEDGELQRQDILFSKGHEPLVYANGGSVAKLSTVAGAAGVSSTMFGNEVIAGYGRLWTADFSTDKSTIYWSDELLLGHVWSGGISIILLIFLKFGLTDTTK